MQPQHTCEGAQAIENTFHSIEHLIIVKYR
jgi:hypothetical protein